ncbi:tape measure protein [Citromicrobium bathyomarinum]
MPEIDPVVLELKVRHEAYLNGVRLTTRTVDRELGTQEKRVRMLEQQFQRSSGQISSTLKGLAGTLATYFTGRELIGLIDSFTRLQNNLRVAGQEGENLARVQESLLAISAQYGVDVETLSGVFLKASLAQRELNASTEDIIRLNEIVAASLKVTGTSAEQARGALLQLGQALGSDVVRGEEFNSLLENALPVVQAAANGIERMGGSVAKLRQEVVNSNVSSKEFFEGILRGGVKTIEDAERATLTLSGAFEALRSQLVVYFGEASKSNGATAALASAIQSLSENLDTIIPAIAVIGTALGVGYVTNLVRAHLATVTLTTATRGLLAALGGPVGIAITAVAAGLGYMAAQAATAEKALGQQGRAAKTAADFNERLNGILNADPSDDVARGARNLAGARRDAAKAAYEQAAAEIALRKAQGERDLRLARQGKQEVTRRRRVGTGPGRMPVFEEYTTTEPIKERADNRYRGGVNRQQGAINAATAEIAQAERDLRDLKGAYREAIAQAPGGSPSPASTAKSAKRTSTPREPTGPTSSDIAARQADEIARLQAEELQARIQLTSDAEDRAQLQRELLEIERDQRIRQIEGDKELSGEQKAAQIEIIRNLYGVASQVDEQGRIVVEANKSLYAQQIAQDEQAEFIRRGLQLSTEINRTQQDLLSSQAALVDDREERARLERSILDLQHEQERNELRASIAQLEIAGAKEAELEAAKRRLALIEEVQANEREGLNREYESPLQRYRRLINKTDGQLQDQAEQAVVDEIESVRRGMRDGLAEAIGTDDPFIKGLLDILIEQVLLRPIADALASATAAGSGGLGPIFGIVSGLIGSIFGRASGGRVAPGQVVRVNEGASPGRVEGFVGPSTGGQIVPLGRMAAAQPMAQAPATATVRLELSGEIDTRIQRVSGPVAIEVVRASADPLTERAVNETMRRAGRPRL